MVQVSSLDDIKTNSQTDSNAAKTMALDHLGVIAARIRSSMLKFQNDAGSRKGLKPLDDVSILCFLLLLVLVDICFPFRSCLTLILKR